MALVVEIVRIELFDPPDDILRLGELRLSPSPVGVELAASFTVPPKLFVPTTVIVDVAELPGTMVRLATLELMVKSGEVDWDWRASAIAAQLSATLAVNVTGKFVTVDFTTSYSAALFTPSVVVISVNPDSVD